MDSLALSRAAPAEEFPQPPRFGRIRCLSPSGFHGIAFTDWGDRDAADAVVCVHGLTRQGRDFDVLAAALAAQGMRVVCPDLVGRGRSDWLPTTFGYAFPQYCADMATLIAALAPARVHFVGTSLGGLIGMALAGVPNTPIARLVVNDIGPDVPANAVVRVGARLARDPSSYASLEEAIGYNRHTFSGCGELTEAQWRHFTEHSLSRDAKTGRLTPRLDPHVGVAFAWLTSYQATLWGFWDAIRIPVLTVYGAESDFLPRYILDSMQRRAPQMTTHRVPDTGHMPMFMKDDEIAAVVNFLTARAPRERTQENAP